jgi:hypothetical protein
MRTKARWLGAIAGAIPLVAAGLLAATGPAAVAAPVTGGLPAIHFEWTAQSGVSGDSASINTGATNDEPGDVLFVTPNPYRGATCPCLAVSPLPAIGVRYDRAAGQWAVVLENKSAMPSDESFNVLAEPRTGPDTFVQKATAKNSAGNHTFIDAPAINSKPGATIEVTQVVNPGGTSGGHYNPNPIGVRYYPARRRWAVINEDGARMPLGAAFNILVGKPASPGDGTRTLTARATNTTGEAVLFSSSVSNGRPGSMTFVTPVWNPGGKGGTTSTAQTSVGYDTTLGRWAVVDEQGKSVPLGSAYNLLIYPEEQYPVTHFEWTADGGNVTGDAAHIDSVTTNDQPHDVLFVTPNPYRGATCPCLAVAPLPAIGVWYDRLTDQWAVVTENQSSMPDGESFNVLAEPAVGGAVLVHTAARSNTSGDRTFLNSSLTNGRPKAVLEVTQVVNPGGRAGAVFNPHPIGVRYYPAQRRWAVINEDGAKLPAGASFNVLVGTSASNGASTKTVTVTTGDQLGNAVLFSSAKSNGLPGSLTFVTPVWNPDGKGGVRSAIQTSVSYDTSVSKWAVVSERPVSLPLGSAYNLLIYSS